MPADGHPRRLGGVLVNDELLRALSTESVPALGHWFGMSPHSVRTIRRRLGVSGLTAGWKRLQMRNCLLGAAEVRGKPLSPAERARRRELALAGNFIQYPRAKQRPERTWTAEELALLGTMSDQCLADRIGTTWAVVRGKRSRLGIPTFTSLKPVITTPIHELPTLAARLKAARLKAGLTQKALAGAAGLSVAIVGMMEQGAKTNPYASTILALAGALGVGCEDLIGRSAKRDGKGA